MKICDHCSEIKHEVQVKQELLESGDHPGAVGVNHLLELAYDDWPLENGNGFDEYGIKREGGKGKARKRKRGRPKKGEEKEEKDPSSSSEKVKKPRMRKAREAISTALKLKMLRRGKIMGRMRRQRVRARG